MRADWIRSRALVPTASRDADQRMLLLESIVQSYLGTADLSMETLRQAATATQAQGLAIGTEAQEVVSAQADDASISCQPGQSIMEERYTIQPVGNNVTRKPNVHLQGEDNK